MVFLTMTEAEYKSSNYAVGLYAEDFTEGRRVTWLYQRVNSMSYCRVRKKG